MAKIIVQNTDITVLGVEGQDIYPSLTWRRQRTEMAEPPM